MLYATTPSAHAGQKKTQLRLLLKPQVSVTEALSVTASAARKADVNWKLLISNNQCGIDWGLSRLAAF